MIATVYFFAAAVMFGAALIGAAYRQGVLTAGYFLSSALFGVAGVMQLISEGVIS